MIKFRAGNLVGLGLSKMNIRKLKEGKPILVEGAELGIELDIFVMYGNTEKEMVADLHKAGLIKDDTPVQPAASCDD